MSTINVQCTDQVLAITNSPVIASGGINENDIQFSFCSKWDGYAKICVFYRQTGNYYYSLIDSNDKCLIPAECCTSAGKIYFGVVGTKDNVTRTSEVLAYQIVEGAITTIDDPTPDIYQQILNELAAIREILEKGQMDINGLTDETDVANGDYFPFYDVSASANRKTLWSNIIDKIRAAFKTTSLPVDSGGTGATDAETARTNLGALSSADGAVGASNLAENAVKLTFTNYTVWYTNWEDDPDNSYADFPYRAPVYLSGATTDMIPEVIFSPTDALSGTLAPVAKSDSDKIYIYATEALAADIVIPTVILWR